MQHCQFVLRSRWQVPERGSKLFSGRAINLIVAGRYDGGGAPAPSALCLAVLSFTDASRGPHVALHKELAAGEQTHRISHCPSSSRCSVQGNFVSEHFTTLRNIFSCVLRADLERWLLLRSCKCGFVEAAPLHNAYSSCFIVFLKATLLLSRSTLITSIPASRVELHLLN